MDIWSGETLSQHPKSWQEATMCQVKDLSRRMPPSFRSFQCARLVEHSLLERVCLDRFSAVHSKFYIHKFSNIPLGGTLCVPFLVASLSNKHLVGTWVNGVGQGGAQGVFKKPLNSAPAQGQQLQPKQTSEGTSLLRLCCRASVCHTGKGILDVAFRVPRDEGRSCRRHLLRVPINVRLMSGWNPVQNPWTHVFRRYKAYCDSGEKEDSGWNLAQFVQPPSHEVCIGPARTIPWTGKSVKAAFGASKSLSKWCSWSLKSVSTKTRSPSDWLELLWNNYFEKNAIFK